MMELKIKDTLKKMDRVFERIEELRLLLEQSKQTEIQIRINCIKWAFYMGTYYQKNIEPMKDQIMKKRIESQIEINALCMAGVFEF